MVAALELHKGKAFGHASGTVCGDVRVCDGPKALKHLPQLVIAAEALQHRVQPELAKVMGVQYRPWALSRVA